MYTINTRCHWLAVGADLIVAAGLATAADWKEFFQYFRGKQI
ncbi:hypothetical protein Tsubulata_011996, partial [Turnera subulata]